MAQFIDQLFCPNMRGLLIVKFRLREVAGSIPEELRFFVISLRQYCTGQLYLSAVFYPLPYVKIGLREGRGIESRRAQIFLLFCTVQGSCICRLSYVKIPRDPIAGGSRDRFPTSSDFLLLGSCLYLSALRARKIYIRYPPY